LTVSLRQTFLEQIVQLSFTHFLAMPLPQSSEQQRTGSAPGENHDQGFRQGVVQVMHSPVRPEDDQRQDEKTPQPDSQCPRRRRLAEVWRAALVA
jgi:hypothetical protein